MATTTRRSISLRPKDIRALLEHGRVKLTWKLHGQPCYTAYQLSGREIYYWTTASQGRYIEYSGSCGTLLPGDLAWVREAFKLVEREGQRFVCYRDDSSKRLPRKPRSGWENLGKWQDAADMPRWAHRLVVEMERVEIQIGSEKAQLIEWVRLRGGDQP